ncbi:MAG: T9SS type A sorting domain-containing protein, partial [Bacteroidales bacterium]|nr:T9SS type A sorting domain-containing protein [Bacteroidales bacterium]
DSTSTGGSSTSTDNDSTSTGGGDSYIATVLADKDIELYPNPADEVLNIRSDYNITEIEVIDAMNRVIERWELNTRELTLDIASYKSGTYFIIIKTDKGSLTKKFIVR